MTSGCHNTDRRRKEAKEWKVGNKIMLSMKDLVFKERLVWYIGPYNFNENSPGSECQSSSTI